MANVHHPLQLGQRGVVAGNAQVTFTDITQVLSFLDSIPVAEAHKSKQSLNAI